jgi:single-strand selective monofunctional uracil DNA glycosylase
MGNTPFDDIIDEWLIELRSLRFTPPVTHIYNPLEYARKPHDLYFERYGTGTKDVILVGMNPGPWGMVQTGVPFGEISIVIEWLGIREEVDQPENPHPKRPVEGFSCRRSEVSGKRLWGWARERFGTPERFFKRFMVFNYCPLVFWDTNGKNKTPNTLKVAQRKPLHQACDRALRRMIGYWQPEFVVGVGAYARDQVAEALAEFDVTVGGISHPSPANPKANRGWVELIEKEFSDMGIAVS